MAVVSETIPQGLQAPVNAAVEWFNTVQPETFEVTGIVDADQSLVSGEPLELHLVLCGGDLCQRQDFRVSRSDAGFDVALIEDPASSQTGNAPLQSELDPPPGARRNWLDSVLSQHSFTLLLFYRGFW